MIKKRFLIFLIIAALLYAYNDRLVEWVNKKLTYSNCDNPMGFFVQTVDPKFAITKEKVIQNTKLAADIWNESYNTNLFVYDTENGIPISLLFDDRQRLLTSISEKSSTVEEEKTNLGESISTFEQKKEQITKELEELEKEINYWNSKGGAPKDIYEELVEKRDKLAQEIKNINTEAEKLNQSTNKVNELIGGLNNTIQNFNSLLDIKPEGGLYYPQERKIEIYFYDTDNQYMHIAAHELGHYLGLEHTQNPKSLMSPTISDTILPAVEDLDQLASYCKQRNILEDFSKLLTSKLQ